MTKVAATKLVSRYFTKDRYAVLGNVMSTNRLLLGLTFCGYEHQRGGLFLGINKIDASYDRTAISMSEGVWFSEEELVDLISALTEALCIKRDERDQKEEA